MTRRTAAIAIVTIFTTLAFGLIPTAVAAKGAGPTAGCTQNTPSATVNNNWQWGSTGSWGTPGQQLTYSLRVVNNDVGCSSSSFVVGVSAPSGFSVSVPTSTINLKSSTSGNLSAYVTSPTAVPDGDYPLTVTVERAGTSNTASSTSYYKVYSSDSVAPTLFWPNPGDGTTISGRSYNVTASSSDDHAVKKVELYMDNAYVTTKTCDDLTYICQLNYSWPLRRVQGQHTATFKSYDWMGNVGVLTVAFTVS